VILVELVLKENREYRVTLELKVPQDMLVLRVQLVLRVLRVYKVIVEQLVNKVKLVIQDVMDRLVCEERRVE
jgi:hypothetical protein